MAWICRGCEQSTTGRSTMRYRRRHEPVRTGQSRLITVLPASSSTTCFRTCGMTTSTDAPPTTTWPKMSYGQRSNSLTGCLPTGSQSSQISTRTPYGGGPTVNPS